MVAILRLVWGLITKILPGLGMAAGSATALAVSSTAARTIAVGAAIVALILWIPMPSWLTGVPSLVSNIPSGVVYVMGYARVKEGITIILGAMVVRFLARLALKAIG